MENLEEQFEQKMVKINKETLVNELKEKLDKFYGAGAMKAHEKVFVFANSIREKYPDYSECRLWHLLIFSTISDDTKITRFDFPGDYSIEKFIKSL